MTDTRAEFEAAYIAHLKQQWPLNKCTPQDLAVMREGDGYGDSASHLTGAWWGWKAASVLGGEVVGEASAMPGTDGFTMACFRADDVPLGTPLFVHPAPSTEPVVPANVMAALDRMCTPLHESRLSGATAEADAHSMKLIRDYVLSTAPAQASDTVYRVLDDLLSYAEQNVCMHENTHRGGAIWEVCDDCGAQWADDQGGKPEFEWPKAISAARAVFNEMETDPVQDLLESKPAVPEGFVLVPIEPTPEMIDAGFKKGTGARHVYAAMLAASPAAPAQSCGDAEQAEGARFGAVELILRDVCETDPADPDMNDTVCINISDLETIVERHIGTQSTLEWAVGRWNAEVSSRPLVNVHRRSLDDTWRQVIRHLGGDDATLLGPRHSELLAAAPLPRAAEQADEAVTDDASQIATIVKDLIETLMLWNGQASAGLDVSGLAGLRDELVELAARAKDGK